MTSEIDNSLTDAATPSRKRLLKGYQNPQEQERRKRAQQRLKEVYSSIPWYKEQAEKWVKFGRDRHKYETRHLAGFLVIAHRPKPIG